MIGLQIDRPSPVPPEPVLVLVLCTNLSNTDSSSPAGMPTPWSLTPMTTPASCAEELPVTSTRTLTVAPCGENLIALDSRLPITCVTRSASHHAPAGPPVW